MASVSKSQRNLIIVLLLVLTYAVFDFVTNREQYLGFYKNTKKATQKVQEEKQPPSQFKKAANADAAYLKNWGRDPFYDPGLHRKPVHRSLRRVEVSLRLKAISYSGPNSVAMINNKILSVGEIIEGYRVVKIEPGRVILTRGSKRKILTLN